MTLELSATIRNNLGKKAALSRKAGKIPAVIYGHQKENLNLEFDYVEFEKILAQARESTLINLKIVGKNPVKAIITDIQRDPITDKIIHADIQQVDMKEKINVKVPLKFVGESKAVKEEGAVLIHNISEIEIHCLPEDLINEILVDISKLEKINDNIKIKDLKLPVKIEILHHHPDDVIALVLAPKEEKEETKEETATTAPAETEETTPTKETKEKESN